VTPAATGDAPPSPIVFDVGEGSGEDDDDAATIGSRLRKFVTP
jgi:hypothetical protein